MTSVRDALGERERDLALAVERVDAFEQSVRSRDLRGVAVGGDEARQRGADTRRA